MTYAADHADALADLQSSGAAVTFTTRTATHDAATDTWSGTSATTVTGAAIRVTPTAAERDRYRAAGLTVEQVVTLLFAPATFGSLPTVNATVVWGGSTLTVRDIGPLAPDGTAILARVGCCA